MPLLLVPAGIAAAAGWGLSQAIGAWWGAGSLWNRLLTIAVGVGLAFLAVVFLWKDAGVLRKDGLLAVFIGSMERVALAVVGAVRDVLSTVLGPLLKLLGVVL